MIGTIIALAVIALVAAAIYKFNFQNKHWKNDTPIDKDVREWGK